MQELVLVIIHQVDNRVALVNHAARVEAPILRQLITGDRVAVPIVLLQERLPILLQVIIRGTINGKDVTVVGETIVIIHRVLRRGKRLQRLIAKADELRVAAIEIEETDPIVIKERDGASPFLEAMGKLKIIKITTGTFREMKGKKPGDGAVPLVDGDDSLPFGRIKSCQH